MSRLKMTRDGRKFTRSALLPFSAKVLIMSSGLFDGQVIMLSKETGETLRTWLEAGADVQGVDIQKGGEA